MADLFPLPDPVRSVTGAEVARLLRSVRMSVAVEVEAQAEIASALIAAGLPAVREVVLDARNRIDLMVGSVGVEVKVKGDRRAIFRQLHRYCDFPEIKELVLVTGIAMSLPSEINGRNLHIVSMGRAWL